MTYPNNQNIIHNVWYLEYPTPQGTPRKFYRAIVFDEDGQWYTAYHWGSGSARGDVYWVTASSPLVHKHVSHEVAARAALAKVQSKIDKGYEGVGWSQHAVVPDDLLVPHRVRKTATSARSAVPARPQPPVTPPAVVSITSSDGRTKPALARKRITITKG